MGAAQPIVQNVLRMNAQQLVDCGNDVSGSRGLVRRKGARLITGTVDETGPNTASGQQDGVAIVPMVAAGVVPIDLRCATEITEHRDQRTIEHISICKIL